MSTEKAVRPPATLRANDLRDTRGAARILGERMGKKGNVSVDTVHRFVREGMLRAYVFDDEGQLIERVPTQEKRSGQALYFAMPDLYAVDLPDPPGRPPKRK